jgi:hypothetical protein
MKRSNLLLLALIWLSLSGAVYASDLIAGIAIAQNDQVYVWHKDGMVTVGSAYHFEKYSTARPYTLPGGKHVSDIIAISIAGSDNHVYVWYRDGYASSGTATNLAQYRAPYPYSLPPGKTAANIVGIGIAKDDRVYTWYDDRTFTIGTTADLDKHHASQPYLLPGGRLPASIVEIDIAKSIDRVHVWYEDGMGSSGSFDNLGNHDASYAYIPAQVISRWWGPQSAALAPLPQLANSAEETPTLRLKQLDDDSDLPVHRRPQDGLNDEASDAASESSPAFSTPIYPASGALDPMLAVGNQYLIVSDTGSLAFYDKQGHLLPDKNGMPGKVSTATFFSGFVAKTNADGSLNERNINLYLGFPKPCDSPDYPQTDTGKRFCISQFYDTRVYFDPTSKRFFIVCNSRHRLYIGDSVKNEYGTCGKYVDSDGNNVPTNQYCDLTRRYVAFAVSKTEDPRDGFYQYILTETNYRDWPWLSVNGDAFVISHQGDDTITGPVATVFSVSAIKNGVQHPPYFRYYTADVDGIKRVLPPTHYGPGLTLLLGSNDNKGLRIFGFAPSNDMWTAPKLLTASINFNDGLPSFRGAVYRNDKLYLVSPLEVEANGDTKRYSVRVARIPLEKMGSSLSASKDSAKGFLDRFFGRNARSDAPGDRLSYEKISMAVNKNGDMFFGYRRNPFASANPLYPEARYTVWYANETKQRRSYLLRKGDAACTAKIDYTTAVVDPSDDKTFWVALPYADSTGAYRTVVAKISP